MTDFSYYFEYTIDNLLSFHYYLSRLKAAIQSWFYWVNNYDNPNWHLYDIRNKNWSYFYKNGNNTERYHNFWIIINAGMYEMWENYLQDNYSN